ncbi:MAG: DNA-protecting protein DprA [Gemmatimonadaceae bacterium]|nr:DNA-protecting protein DprA [Gemmatimonadaceae bacterium]
MRLFPEAVGCLDLDVLPQRLSDLRDPPQGLFAIGHPDVLTSPCVSIVGTRDPTDYGLTVTRRIAGALARAGICIISGMARGIDAAAHRAALEAGGLTVAVLGTGIDVPYPASHQELHRVIGERGLLLSENGPGATAHKGAFPKRNRIIAALGEFTIVVEAGLKSGALNTAAQALNIGRTVASVPGRIDSPQSAGTNQLLRDGASVIASVEDALALAGVSVSAPSPPVQLAASDARVWAALSAGPLPIDAVAARSGLAARDCLTSVTSLELLGMVECLMSGEIRRR